MIKKVKPNTSKALPSKLILVAAALYLPAIKGIAQAESIVGAISSISPLEQTFYNSGKIYVVVAVALVILIGIFAYLIRADRRITRLEKEFHQRSTRP